MNFLHVSVKLPSAGKPSIFTARTLVAASLGRFLLNHMLSSQILDRFSNRMLSSDESF